MLAQLLLVAALHAAPSAPDKKGDAGDASVACWSLPSNADTHNCLAAILGQEDGRLNRDYRRVIAVLGPSRRERLRASERRWVVRVQHTCNAEAESLSTGSMYPLYFDQCAIFETQGRREWLRKFNRTAK